ncbi:MAG: TlpA family protein disulfide reductase [Thiobacillus sp.]
MRSKWLYAFPLALLALVVGAWFAQTRYAPRAPSLPVGQLWQLNFPDTAGRPQPFAQWRGKVLVLNFWASWCAPCREEMPEFSALRDRYAPHGVEFVGLAIDNAASVTRFLARQPVTYPILIGEGSAHSLARELGNTSGALPYTLVLDPEGGIVLQHLGRLPGEVLEAALLGTGI